MEGILRFSLTQNGGKFPELEPYDVIKYLGVDPIPAWEGFSGCDEYGIAEWLPSNQMFFRAANEETELAFIGDKVVENGITLLVVREVRKEKN